MLKFSFPLYFAMAILPAFAAAQMVNSQICKASIFPYKPDCVDCAPWVKDRAVGVTFDLRKGSKGTYIFIAVLENDPKIVVDDLQCTFSERSAFHCESKGKSISMEPQMDDRRPDYTLYMHLKATGVEDVKEQLLRPYNDFSCSRD